MATFRKYGGTNFSPISNIVRHNILNSKSSSFNTSGLYNTKETYLSHLDMSGNSLLHVGNIYFQDGTFISSATDSNNGLSEVLGYGSSAGGQSMTDVGGIGYVGGTNQTSAYTGWTGSNTYKSATLTFDTNGKIIDVMDNSLSPYGLGDVLTKSEDGGGKNMTNLGNIIQADNYNIYQSGTGIINQLGTGTNLLKDTSFNGNITQTGDEFIINQTGTGKNILKETKFNGNIIQNGNDEIINQSGTGTNLLKDTSFNGNITQTGDEFIINQTGTGKNILKETKFNGNIIQNGNDKIINQSGTGTNLLKDTSFNGNITQTGDEFIINQSGTGTNLLKDTKFNGICEYVNSYDGYGVTSPNSIPDRAYVDTIASGIKPTGLCKCATTGDIDLNITYSSLSIDTYTVLDQDRILVKSQGATSDNESTLDISNGIYIYLQGSLTRAEDCSIGDIVTNQLTFISDGCLNRMKAFVQDVSGAVVGDNSLNYVPFYSLNYNLGQGLELVGGATLQVKSDLDFLENIDVLGNLTVSSFTTFNDRLYMNSSDAGNRYIQTSYIDYKTISESEPSYAITQLYQGYGNFVLHNTARNKGHMSAPDTPIRFSFFCNDVSTNETDLSLANPLQFNNNYFNLSLLTQNNGSLEYDVRYEACSKNYYTLPIGHNFTGDCYIDGSGGTFNPHLTIRQKSVSSNRMEHYTNLDSDGNYSGIPKKGDNAIVTYKPLSIVHYSNDYSGIRIDVSNVRLQVTSNGNTNYYDLSLSSGHIFDGSVNILNNLTVAGNSNLKIGPDALNNYAYLSGICQSGNIGDNSPWNNFNSSNWHYSSRVTSIYDSNNSGPFPNNNVWYNLINVRHRGGTGSDSLLYGCQIVTGMTNYENRMAFRGQYNNGWLLWNEVAVLGNDNTFTGTCNFNKAISFEGKTTKTYNLINSLGGLKILENVTPLETGSTVGSTRRLFSSLNQFSTYIMFFSACVALRNGGGDNDPLYLFQIDIMTNNNNVLATFNYGSLIYWSNSTGNMTKYSASCYIYNMSNNSTYDVDVKLITSVQQGTWNFNLEDVKLVRIS
jgi:hypothetical protein